MFRLAWILPIISMMAAAWAVCPEYAVANTLRFRLTAEPVTLDWNLAHSSHETYIIMNIMEGLIEHGPDLNPRPALAESWAASADGKTLTFKLRENLSWSDGKALTAQHFVDSWLRLLDPKTRSPYASFLYDVENARVFHSGKLKARAQVGVRAIGARTLEVRLEKPTPHFLHIPTFWVTFPIRMDLLKKHGKNWTEPGKIVTLGPYLLDAREAGRMLKLKSNPGWRGAGKDTDKTAKEVVAVIEPDDTKARALFARGEIDFLLEATTADLISGRFRAEQFPYLATYYLGFNTRKAPLDAVAFRKALALALDPAEFPPLLQGGQTTAKGWLPPGLPGYDSGAQIKPSLFNARRALVEAGYPEGTKPPKLMLWVEKFDRSELLGTAIAKTLRERLGIDVAVQPQESKRYAERYRSALQKGEAHLFVGHWGADFPDASNFFDVFATGSGNNSTGWADPAYDAHLQAARAAPGLSGEESSTRLRAYAAAEKLLLSDAVAILPLFYRKNTVLLGPKVESFSLSPLNYLFLNRVFLNFGLNPGVTPGN